MSQILSKFYEGKFSQNIYKKKNIYTKNATFGSILSFKFQFGIFNPTVINTEQAKYKEMFGRVNSPTKGAEKLRFGTTVVHGSLQEIGYTNIENH